MHIVRALAAAATKIHRVVVPAIATIASTAYPQKCSISVNQRRVCRIAPQQKTPSAPHKTCCSCKCPLSSAGSRSTVIPSGWHAVSAKTGWVGLDDLNNFTATATDTYACVLQIHKTKSKYAHTTRDMMPGSVVHLFHLMNQCKSLMHAVTYPPPKQHCSKSCPFHCMATHALVAQALTKGTVHLTSCNPEHAHISSKAQHTTASLGMLVTQMHLHSSTDTPGSS